MQSLAGDGPTCAVSRQWGSGIQDEDLNTVIEGSLTWRTASPGARFQAFIYPR